MAFFLTMNSSGDDPKRKPRSGSPAWLSSLSFSVILPLGIIWIANGTDSFCSNVWVPLPFIGYFRWDCAVLGFCLGELPVFWLCSKGNRIAWLLAILLMTLPFWPRQPVFYTLSPSTFLQLLHENGVSPFGKSIQILDSGLSNKDADRFLEIAWKHKTNWTHASAAKALGYYQFGKSENIDRKSTARPPFWSLQLGFLPSHTTLARESIYRQHFPEQQDHVQDIIRREMLPTLRGIYAQALNTTNVIFGEELDPKLGLPSIAIIAPNAMWSWIVNVHTDKNYQDRIAETAAKTNCTITPEIRAFIMPLTTPKGAGLRYWKDKDDYVEIIYEKGKMYSFDAATVHAIRPLPYYEWNRREMRVILQAFALRCDDERWVLYH